MYMYNFFFGGGILVGAMVHSMNDNRGWPGVIAASAMAIIQGIVLLFLSKKHRQKP